MLSFHSVPLSAQMFLAKTLGDKVMAHQACLPDSRSVLEGLACATSNLGDYDRMKESLSMFLPPHLLEPSILPGKIERWVWLCVVSIHLTIFTRPLI